MEFALQFGHGMMDHSISLCSEWGGGTVILSPRDIKPEWLASQAGKIAQVEGVRLLFDPQWYVPHANHERLKSHDSFPASYDSGTFFGGNDLTRSVASIAAVNLEIGTAAVILPGLLSETVNDEWLERQEQIAAACATQMPARRRMATIALGGPAVADVNQIHEVLERVPTWNVQGVYIVLQHPNGGYFVEDPIWLGNALDFIAGLRLKGVEVVVGYCNQQMLIAAAAGANAVASGTWKNVRVFSPEKFYEPEEEQKLQRALWYYCPQALSEYKVRALDVAKQLGVLHKMAVPTHLQQYSSLLFGEAQPSTVAYGEPDSFRHYLACLRDQVMHTRKESFAATVAHHEAGLNQAEQLLKELRSVAVRADDRDFTESINANRAALKILEQRRGVILEQRWATLA